MLLIKLIHVQRRREPGIDVGKELVCMVSQIKIQIPIVAIGGITVNNAHDVIETGIDAIAVITSLYEAKTIKETAETFLRMFH